MKAFSNLGACVGFADCGHILFMRGRHIHDELRSSTHKQQRTIHGAMAFWKFFCAMRVASSARRPIRPQSGGASGVTRAERLSIPIIAPDAVSSCRAPAYALRRCALPRRGPLHMLVAHARECIARWTCDASRSARSLHPVLVVACMWAHCAMALSQAVTTCQEMKPNENRGTRIGFTFF
jgi:hypothetical protein